MDVKELKTCIHSLELNDHYDAIYSIIKSESEKSMIEPKMYCFLLRETIFALEEIESPFCKSASLYGKYDLFYELFRSLIYYKLNNNPDDKYIDWHICYILYNYPRFHYIIDIYGGIRGVEKAKKDMFDYCAKKYTDSLLFNYIPMLSEYNPDPEPRTNKSLLKQLCDEIDGFELGNTYVDEDLDELLKSSLPKCLE